jgi:putative ABC transport system permease protein
MSLLDGLRHRLYVALRGEAYSREVRRELEFHADLEALAHTEPSIGNVTYYREEVRRMTLLRWLDRVAQDATYAWRGLKRSPGFTITVVLTLGLGIGVNAAMFSLLDQLFVRPPLGVVAPKEVVRLYDEVSRPTEPSGRLAYDHFMYPQYRAMRLADSTLPIAMFTEPDSTAIVDGDARIPVRQSLVTAAYFHLLGVRPKRGRFFTAEEDRIEAPTRVAVLSDALWRSAYNADPAILGKTISLDMKPTVVVGVAPPDFTGLDLDAVDIWLPANNWDGSGFGGQPWYDTFQNSFRLVARAADGGTLERVRTVATSAVRSVHLNGFQYDSTAVVLSGSIVRALGPAKSAQEFSISTRLAGVALVVLLIACANVANLLLVRATRRQREVAVRRALGGTKAQLYQQVLIESLVLSALGGIAAILFAYWAGSALRGLMMPNIHWAGGAIGLRTIAFASLVALVTAFAAGLAPALQATRPDLVNSLKAGMREGAYQRSRLRSVLLAAQAALSVLLLIGAGLFVQSLKNIRGLDLGYDVDHVLTARPTFVTSPPATQIASAMPPLVERLRTVPGVEAVGYATAGPMGGYSVAGLFLPDRDSLPTLGAEGGASMIAVSSDYFRAAGVRLVAGRYFGEGDRPSAGGAPIVVGEAMARVFWPGQSALGKCLILGERANPCSVVVGVVADVHRMEIIEAPTMQYYVPISESTRGVRVAVIRATDGAVPAVTRIVAQEMKRAFPQMDVPRIRSMKTMLEPQFRPWRLGATLFTAFGVLALVVAGIGVYSVISYAVSQRTNEMGIRLALGAHVGDIMRLVLGESSRVVVVGVLLGIGSAIVLGRLVASLLYGVSPRDPLVFAGAAVLLLAIGLIASLVPAWRATRVDPSSTLRAD